ncbi:hypothetical protein L6R29_18555 [Myxococcota bacterium]|nr:hypothetical protein [Myxococcota bacterium]
MIARSRIFNSNNIDVCLLCFSTTHLGKQPSPAKRQIASSHKIQELCDQNVGAIRCRHPVLGQPQEAAPTYFDHTIRDIQTTNPAQAVQTPSVKDFRSTAQGGTIQRPPTHT